MVGNYMDFNGNGDYTNNNGNMENTSNYQANMSNLGPKKLQKVDNLIDYKKIFSVLNKYKFIILFFILLSAGISYYLAYYYLPPIYESQSSLLISKKDNGYPQSENSYISKLVSSSYSFGIGNTVNNAIEILKSKRLANEISKQLLEIKYMSNGKLFPILWSEYPLDSTIVSQRSLAHRLQKEIKVEQSKLVSDVITISYDSYSPYEAARLVNLAINAFSELSLNQNRSVAHSALEFLNNEKSKVKMNLEEAEANLSSFMNKENLVELDAQTNELVKNLSELESQRQGIRIKLVAINTALDNYQTQLNSIRPGLAEKYSESVMPTLSGYQYRLAELETEKLLIISKNPRLKNNADTAPELQKINSQIKMLRGEIAKLTGDLIKEDDKYPGLFNSGDGNIINEISDLRKKMLELNVEKSQYSAQSRVLDERIADYKANFEKVPANMIQLARKKRDVQMNEQLYISLAQQATEMGLYEKTQGSYGQVIDYAEVPTGPVKPQKELIMILGIFLGFIFPVGFVFMRETLVTKINSVEKMRNKPVPLLTVIPEMRPIIRKSFSRKAFVKINETRVSSYLLTLLDSISPAAESFRRLQSNVIYSQPDDSLRTILVTSPNKEEGKTTLVGNFAISLAEEGKKVLIMDCDFRRPGISSIFGLDDSPGIMEILFNNKPVENVIQETVIRNVFVLTSGRRPPNPAAINRSYKLKNLINSLKDQYDHLILDTPPYGIITDAAPLLKIADGVILVAKFGQTKEAELDLTIENLIRTRANIIGTALTSFNHRKSSDYYYHKSQYKYNYSSYKNYHKKGKQKVKV